MCNGIKVWRLCWPWQNIDIMVFKPFCSQFWCMLGIIVLLKDSVFFINRMEIYCSAFILPSMSHNIPIPFHPIQPHTIKFPPPNLTVPFTSLSPSWSPAFFYTYSWSSNPSLLTLVSSDQIALFQSSTVQCWCFKAKASLFFLELVTEGVFSSWLQLLG